MSLLDRLRSNGDGAGDATLSEQFQRATWQNELLSENLRTLEQSMSDDGWRRLNADLSHEFTRAGLDDLMSLSRAMYLSNPLIQRAVNITTYYTWGQGVEFVTADDAIMEQVILPMINDVGNQAELYSHQARLLTDVDQIVDGNTFFALFKGDPVRVRSIPADQVRAIHRDPNDRQHVLYYLREWTSVEFNETNGREQRVENKALYPDLNHAPASQPDSIGGIDVRWDSPVIHQRIGGLKQMSFGVPGTYAALDWARAYKKFLEDWHTIVSSLARFAWKVSTKGTKVDQVRQKLNIENEDGGTNPSPPAGSVWVGTEEDKITPVPKTGATTSSDDARASRLMVGSAMDLPDTILSGDADVGNQATSKTLDRPTELAMASRQEMWSHWHQRVFAWAIDQAVQDGRLRVPEDKRSVSIKFPAILEHDQRDTVASIVSAATLDGKIEAGTVPRDELARMLMGAIGVEDVAEQIDKLANEDREAVDNAVEALRGVLNE